jgi:predicted nucleic acid-binding protein
MSDERYFLDTNVLVYANDSSDPDRRKVAAQLVGDGIRTGRAVVSSQILSEFWVTVTQKIRVPLGRDAAEAQIERFAAMTVVPIEYGGVRAAVHFQRRYDISYWDALVIAAAHMGRCPRLYTQDLNHGQHYGELVAVNPFKD